MEKKLENKCAKNWRQTGIEIYLRKKTPKEYRKGCRKKQSKY